MARSVPWRRNCSDAISWHQDQANHTTVFILREMGPTGFLLKEENEPGKFKVFLGDPHSCTCSTFKKEKELCKHLCWVLLRKFKVPRHNAVSWQLGLVEREINEVLRGTVQASRPSHNVRRLAKEAQVLSGLDGCEDVNTGELPQRSISEEDVCPICQEEFLSKRLPVTYCKFGCGNNVHIKCMKVWAEHQKSTGETSIKCPLCRENFGPLASLQQELRNTRVSDVQANIKQEHPGTVCFGCDITPISGKCYKCSVCSEVYFCQRCFNSPTHPGHAFVFREKTSQRWRPAERGSGSFVPHAILQNLMNRDITDNDYDMLLQLDSEGNELSDLTEDTVNSLPLEQIRTSRNPLLAPGQQCRICLQRYVMNQWLRRLPCRHHFHKECIENWLLHNQAKCPIDGMLFTNQSVKRWKDALRKAKQQKPQAQGNTSSKVSTVPSNHLDLISLEIPGIGLARVQRPVSGDAESDRPVTQNLHRGLAFASNRRSQSSHQSDSRIEQNAIMTELGVNGRRTSYSSASDELLLRRHPTRQQSTPTDSPANSPIQPTAPSIPSANSPSAHSRFQGLILDSGSADGRLPPRAPNPGRVGRLRKKQLHNSMRAPKDIITRALHQEEKQLFIGIDAENSSGVIEGSQVSHPRSRQANRRPSSDSNSDSSYRWGGMRLLSGSSNDILLSGNAMRILQEH